MRGAEISSTDHWERTKPNLTLAKVRFSTHHIFEIIIVFVSGLTWIDFCLIQLVTGFNHIAHEFLSLKHITSLNGHLIV